MRPLDLLSPDMQVNQMGTQPPGFMSGFLLQFLTRMATYSAKIVQTGLESLCLYERINLSPQADGSSEHFMLIEFPAKTISLQIHQLKLIFFFTKYPAWCISDQIIDPIKVCSFFMHSKH